MSEWHLSKASCHSNSVNKEDYAKLNKNLFTPKVKTGVGVQNFSHEKLLNKDIHLINSSSSKYSNLNPNLQQFERRQSTK